MIEMEGGDVDVIIVGGGLAGFTAAIHLSKAGLSIMVIEKGHYPRHKVCGEYLSREVIPYLQSLDINVEVLTRIMIDTLSVSLVSGKQTSCALPLGGVGLSRHLLDDVLYKKAISSGVIVINEAVTDISFGQNRFSVSTKAQIYQSSMVIGAAGKRSAIDIRLKRKFILKKSPWLAVKAHYRVEHAFNVVGLHNFPGGYCGVSKVESGDVNVCYLADARLFSKSKNIEDFQQQYLSRNPYLKNIFETESVFKPLTIAQISFADKMPVESHILMIGDCAGVIHPLCGNGMAMAIHSAKIASELVIEFFNGAYRRETMEELYIQSWNANFKTRILLGHHLSKVMQNPLLAGSMMTAFSWMPSVLPGIVRRSHGKIIPGAVW